MGGDNAPINITRRAITFIYLYSSPEGGTRGGGGGAGRVLFTIYQVN